MELVVQHPRQGAINIHCSNYDFIGGGGYFRVDRVLRTWEDARWGTVSLVSVTELDMENSRGADRLRAWTPGAAD